MLYGLQSPSGIIVEETVSADSSECWTKSFDWLCDHGCGNLHGYSADGMEHERDSGVKQEKSWYFMRRFYKRWKPSMDYARRWGYRVVQVRVEAAK